MQISWNKLSLPALLVIGGMIVGCSSEDTTYDKFDESQLEAVHEHDHAHSAPHGGQLIELGEHQFNAEVVLDEEAHKITVYILDAHAENAYAIEEKELTLNLTIDGKPTQYTLAAVRAEGVTEGKASQFEIIDEALVEEFHHHEGLTGRINLTIDGQPFTIDVKHAEHDHDHDDHAEHAHGETGHDDDAEHKGETKKAE